MSQNSYYKFDINVITHYIEAQSDPDLGRYAFSYTINIRNIGTVPAKLLSRYWLITDANGRQQEVNGLGVVGQQPHLKPGEEYVYTSGTMLHTHVGAMEGSYTFIADDNHEFKEHIPAFTLSKPHTLH